MTIGYFIALNEITESMKRLKGERTMRLLTHLILVIILTGWLAPQKAQARLLEKVYGVVNGEIITLTEIREYQEKLKNGGFLNDLLFSDPKVREKAEKNREYLLKLLIDEKIIDFEIKKQGLLVTEERVNKEIETIAKRQNMNAAQLKQTLQMQGVDYSEYRSFVKKSIERRQLVEKEITSKIKISEQDIVSHYLAKSKKSKSQVFEFNLAHILLGPGDQSEAQLVLSQLNEGQSFEALVKNSSIDKDSKQKNGAFGVFKSGEMISSIENAIKNLEIGETSKIVETPMGLHIFKILDKKLVEDPAIQKQKDVIYQQLFAKAFQEQLDFWLLQKRKDAIIQINES
jgi:peptidyl-prolyl cis-trans isomerase SurA